MEEYLFYYIVRFRDSCLKYKYIQMFNQQLKILLQEVCNYFQEVYYCSVQKIVNNHFIRYIVKSESEVNV